MPRRTAADTRQRILDAARAQFARVGIERTTVRAVAAAAEVDPALVLRYFGSKAGLFLESADLDLDLPDVTGLGPREMAEALVHRVFEVWEDDPTFLALLRASATDPAAAERLRRVFVEQAAPAFARVARDRPERRAALAGSQVIGFAFARYVLEIEPVVAMTRDEVAAWLGPTLVGYLTAPMPTD